MKDTKLKILAIILCIFFIAAFFSNIIVASDIEHLQHCTDEYCEKCILIHNADNTLKTIMSIILLILSGIFIFLIITKIKSNKREFMPLTLINCKVQFNE